MWCYAYACYSYVTREAAKHDGFKNRYSLENDDRIYTLAPLTPKQVYEDQIQLKKSYEEEHSA